VLSGSGKTALSFAYQLRHGRPTEHKPSAIIAVGSSVSKIFVEGTGFYDRVMEYSDTSLDLDSELSLRADSKIVICDFGAREGAAVRWLEALRGTGKNAILLGVGGEVVAESPEKSSERNKARAKSMTAYVNASGMRDGAMGILGIKVYFEDSAKAWAAYQNALVGTGLKLVWGEGMEELGRGWEQLCKGNVGPNEGLVFDLSH
jgi:hypothetical protein